MLKKLASVGLFLFVAAFTGCGPGTTINTKPFTDEEKAKIKQEDDAIADEEGGKPVKKKK